MKSNLNFQVKKENGFLVASISKEIGISGLKNISEEDNFNELESQEQNILQIQENLQDKENLQNEEDLQNIENSSSINEIEYPVNTQVIQANNLSESYNAIYKDVKIKNETDFVLSENILTPNLEFTNKKDIIIFHTHTCESYTRNSRKYIYSFWKL